MNKLFKKTLAVVTMVLVGISTGYAQAEQVAVPANVKLAVVDVTAVVSKSAQVKELQKERQQKTEELQNWLKTAREDVQKQSTKEGKEKLLKKYDADFAKKQEALRKDYAAKLKAIDKSISATIAQQAKAKGYYMVFAKGTVLFGGDDITNSVIKAVK